MISRGRVQRLGAALIIAGLFLSTVDVNSAADVPGAYAAEGDALPAASPAPSASPDVALQGADASPSPEPSKEPEAGDLTHLTFAATDGLSASLIAPADDGVAPALSAPVEVETVAGAGVELKVDDTLVPFSRIGRRTVDNKTGVTRYTYYGVPFAPGPNTVTLTALGANAARGTTTVHRIYGPGRPVQLAIEASGPLRADGTGEAQLRIAGTDAWGHHAASGSIVQVTLVSGDARIERAKDVPLAESSTPAPLALSSPDPDPANAHVIRQAVSVPLGADGAALVKLFPGLTPGDLVVRAQAGDVAHETRVFLAPNLRRPFVSGLVTGGAGAVPGIPNQPDGDPSGANARRGRVALFGTGAVGKSLATFAYDTADRLQRTPAYGGAYDGNANDRPYMITGDSSTRRDDALSRDHLYARIDSGRATAQWGEFRASTNGTQSVLGGFDQLVDGARLDLNGESRRASVFVARNDVGYDRRVFAPSGLASGIFLRSDVVVGSEVVILATIDARTGAVIAQTPLTRGVDYSIEYATGQLHFIEVPLPFDEAFNPHQIVLTYEYAAPGNSAMTVGGRVETSFGRDHAVRLGAGYVNDTTGAGNVTLASQDLSGKMSGGSWSIAHATSRGALLSTTSSAVPLGDGGGALHASYNRVVGADRVALLYDRTDAGYNDPFGGLSTPGLLNERLSYAHRFAGTKGEIALDVGHQANAGVTGANDQQTTATLRARRTLSKRLNVTASLERRIATSASGPALVTATPNPLPVSLPVPAAYQPLPAQASTQAAVGVEWRVVPSTTLSVNRLQTLSGTDEIQPTQTDAQLMVDLGKSGRAYVRERWSAAPVQSFAAATQAYTAGIGGTHSTEFGISRALGSATTVESSWMIDHGANGGDVFATMGVRERIKLGKRISGDGFFQHATSAGNAGAAGFNLYGLSLSYADAAQRFRMTGSTQMRNGSGGGTSITLGAVGAISPNFSLFAAINDARAVGSSSSDDRVGVAWRPSRNDNGVTLLQFERQKGTSSFNTTQSGVLSLEQVLRVRTRTELVGRVAYKVDGDSYYAARSSLAAFRADQRVGSTLDIGAEVRQSSIRGIGGTAATALAVEGGVRLGNQTRIGVGYNFSATADPSLSSTPSRRGFYTTITSIVDRLFGWGKHEGP